MKVGLEPLTYRLGWTICPEPTYLAGKCQQDKSWSDEIKWNTTVSMFSRLATVAYDRQNTSILSVESISDPVPVAVNGAAFALYTAIIMAPVNQTLNRTEDAKGYEYAATTFTFGFGIGYILRLYVSRYATYLDGGVSLLRSFVAVPFQFSTAMRQFGDTDAMPAANHVTADLSRASYRAVISPWTVYTFACLSLASSLWCVLGLAWIALRGPHSPTLSFFPEINITSKSSGGGRHGGEGSTEALTSELDPHLEVAEETLEDLGGLTRSHGLGNGDSESVIRSIRGRRVYCGSLPGQRAGERMIMLVTEGGRLKLLNLFEKYS